MNMMESSTTRKEQGEIITNERRRRGKAPSSLARPCFPYKRETSWKYFTSLVQFKLLSSSSFDWFAATSSFGLVLLVPSLFWWFPLVLMDT